MNESDIMMIPFHAHEMDMDRAERANHRLWAIIIILIIALIGTNAGWLVYEAQFVEESISTEIDAEQDGTYNFVSGGDITYGAEGAYQAGNQEESSQDGR